MFVDGSCVHPNQAALARCAGAAVQLSADGLRTEQVIRIGMPRAWHASAAVGEHAAMWIGAYYYESIADEAIGTASVPIGNDPAQNPKTIFLGPSGIVTGSLWLEFRP